jgi:hypothetical protein
MPYETQEFPFFPLSRQSAYEGDKVFRNEYQEIFLVLISVRGRVNPRATVRPRITLMENSNNTIGNRTREIPVFSAVPQPTATHRAPHVLQNIKTTLYKHIHRNHPPTSKTTRLFPHKILATYCKNRNIFSTFMVKYTITVVKIFPQRYMTRLLT